MNHIDFAQVLSAALTPITLISGVGLLLLTMSARYAHTTGRVRQLLRTRNLIGNNDPKLNHAIELIFMRAALLKKTILLVVLSAACSGLLVLASVVEAMFGTPLETLKGILLLGAVGLIVISTIFFSFEVNISLKALGMSVHH